MATSAFPYRSAHVQGYKQDADAELGIPPLCIGDRVYWLGEEDPEPGVVRWVGILTSVSNEWAAGVELDNCVGGMNGTWFGRELFSCPQNHGIVIPVNGLIKEADFFGNNVDDADDSGRRSPYVERNGDERAELEHLGSSSANGVSKKGEGIDAELASSAKLNRGDLEIGRFLSACNNSRSSSFDRRVYARMFAECEVEKWYEALDFSPDVSGSFSELDGDPFPTGKGCTTGVPLPSSRGYSGGETKRTTKKKERGGIFRFFRWLRRSRSSSKGEAGASISSPVQVNTCPQKRRTLPHVPTAVAISRKKAQSLESVTSISRSFHYIPIPRSQEDEEVAAIQAAVDDATDQLYEDLDMDAGTSTQSCSKVKSNSLSRTMAEEREKRRHEFLGDCHKQRSVRSVCGPGSSSSGGSHKKRRAPLPPPGATPGGGTEKQSRSHWVKVLPTRQASVDAVVGCSSVETNSNVVALGRASAGSTGALYGATRHHPSNQGVGPVGVSTPCILKRASSLTVAEADGRLPLAVKPVSSRPARVSSYVKNKRKAPLPPLHIESPLASPLLNGVPEASREQGSTEPSVKGDSNRQVNNASLLPTVSTPKGETGSRPVSMFRCHLEGIGLVNDSQVLLRNRSEKEPYDRTSDLQKSDKFLVGDGPPENITSDIGVDAKIISSSDKEAPNTSVGSTPNIAVIGSTTIMAAASLELQSRSRVARSGVNGSRKRAASLPRMAQTEMQANLEQVFPKHTKLEQGGTKPYQPVVQDTTKESQAGYSDKRNSKTPISNQKEICRNLLSGDSETKNEDTESFVGQKVNSDHQMGRNNSVVLTSDIASGISDVDLLADVERRSSELELVTTDKNNDLQITNIKEKPRPPPSSGSPSPVQTPRFLPSIEHRRCSHTSSSEGSDSSPLLRDTDLVIEEPVNERKQSVVELARTENQVNLKALQDLVESLVLQYCETAKIEEKVTRRADDSPSSLTSSHKESSQETKLLKHSEKIGPESLKKRENVECREEAKSEIVEDDDGENLANELLERWQVRMQENFLSFNLLAQSPNRRVTGDCAAEITNGSVEDGDYEPIGPFLRRRLSQDVVDAPANRGRMKSSAERDTKVEIGDQGDGTDEDETRDPFLFWRDLCLQGSSKGSDRRSGTTDSEKSRALNVIRRLEVRRSVDDISEKNESNSESGSDRVSTNSSSRQSTRSKASLAEYKVYENVVSRNGQRSSRQTSERTSRVHHFPPEQMYFLPGAAPGPRQCQSFGPHVASLPVVPPTSVPPVFQYPCFAGVFPSPRLPYASNYFYPASPSALSLSSNPLYDERFTNDQNGPASRQANCSKRNAKRLSLSSSFKNDCLAFQQNQVARYHLDGAAPGRPTRIERQSSEERWTDALEGDSSDSGGKKMCSNVNRRRDAASRAADVGSTKKRESCETLPPVPPPRASGGSRLAVSSSWLKESSKSVEAKIKEAKQQSVDRGKSNVSAGEQHLQPRSPGDLTQLASQTQPSSPSEKKSSTKNVFAKPSLKSPNFWWQKAAMDSYVVIGGVRVPTPFKLWPLEYRLITPELRIVEARLMGRPLSEDTALENYSGSSDVNVLAVKRLLKLLEVSIGEGQIEEAATYARDLAQLKIQCSVTQNRQPNKNGGVPPIILNMFVEDKISHHGPIPIRVAPAINVGELKLKVFHEFQFPTQIQRWILGKKLAMDDSAPISKFGISGDGCPIFLYLLSLDDVNIESTDLVWDNGIDEQALNGLKGLANKSRRNKAAHLLSEGGSRTNSRPTSRLERQSWHCPQCTLVNTPTRPGCMACGCVRPEDYQLPAKVAEQLEKETEDQKIEKEEIYKALREAKEMNRLRNWQQYLQLDDQDLIYSQVAFECTVCFADTPPGEGVQLRDCLHMFCCDCLRNAVAHSEDASIKCPFRDDSYSCDSTLQEREIRALVPPEVFERHLQRSVVTAESQAANSFHCKTPDCQGWCLIEENANEFLCPACQRLNCITCRVNHQNMNCRQYQDQLDVLARTNDEARKTKEAVESMLERGEAMNCPNCDVVIMKKWGCDWLACSICKTEICWVTKGRRWGPRGRGDVSAGCRCGINGIKCHTQCNYCH